MKFSRIQNSQGAGLIETIFWVAVIAAAGWLYLQYRSNPDTLNSKRATQSPLEDKK